MEIIIPITLVAGIVAALVLIIVAFALIIVVRAVTFKKDRRSERGIYHATIAEAMAGVREAAATDPLVIRSTLRSF